MSTEKINSILNTIYPNGIPVEELGRAAKIAESMQALVQGIPPVDVAQETKVAQAVQQVANTPAASINNSAVLPAETANRSAERNLLRERILKTIKKKPTITELGLSRKFSVKVEEIRAELKELGFDVKNGSPKPGWARMVQKVLTTGPATTVEIADALNIDTICVNRGITALERAGLINREVAGKSSKGVTTYRWSLK